MMMLKSGAGIALFTTLLSACGVAYEPQEFSKSNITYRYKGDFRPAIEVVPLSFTSARAANADGYQPKSLPEIFSQPDPASNILTRDRIAAAGLDQVEPALLFEPPTVPNNLYDGSREVLLPALRNEGLEPLPGLEVPQRSFDFNTPASSLESLPPFSPNTDLSTVLERPEFRRIPANKPIPDIEQPTYEIGVGDVIQLTLQSDLMLSSGRTTNQRPQQFLVQGNGEISIPNIGPIKIQGMTLDEARQVISNRIVTNQLGFDPGVEIIGFNSRTVSVNGLRSADVISINMSPTTLGKTIISTGGFGANPKDTVVRVLRAGTIYEMSGEQILTSTELANRILLNGDVVSVSTGYDPESALAYFNQQIKLRELERSRYNDALAGRAEARVLVAEERSRVRFQIELENYRLEAERLRRQAELELLQARRETDRTNEEARIANVQARQSYLDRLRELAQINRAAIREAQDTSREIMLANQTERLRERKERRELLELELREDQLRIERIAAERRQSRELFTERERLGAVERDYVTVAGETNTQTTMPLPFSGRLTLNRVLYEDTGGVNLVSGDSSEIYVFRTPPQDRIQDKLIAYHLDASNPAAIAVASMFEMRPNDVVYVNPQPITTWNRVLTQILPSTGLLRTGISTVSGFN